MTLSLRSWLRRRPDPGRLRVELLTFSVVALLWGVSFVIRSPLDNGWLNQLEQIARILTPIALGIGIYVAWRRATATDRSVETDRFTKAIEQLGDDDHLAVRLGGIYALEKIAQDEPERYYWTVMEVLCAYVREQCPARKEQLEPGTEDVLDGEIEPPRADIQAILTVLGRRVVKWDKAEIDLSAAWLPSADLSGDFRSDDRGRFSGATFSHSNLRKANFNHSNLRGTSFMNSNLREADLIGANLCDAELRAVLKGAKLNSADLSGAILCNVDLAGVNLLGAKLNGADLCGADLRYTEGLNRDQIYLASGDSKTQLPPGLMRPLSWQY